MRNFPKLTGARIIELASHLRVSKQPALPERCINRYPARRLHEEVRANAAGTIGPVMKLFREAGHPALQEFIGYYLAAPEGRSEDRLAELIESLYSHCASHGFNDCQYTPEAVAEWFLHLLFVRTVEGGHAERQLLQKLIDVDSGWRYSTDAEDRLLELDLLHDIQRKVGSPGTELEFAL